MILSLVRSQVSNPKTMANNPFFNDIQRINVAMTRAKHGCIVFSNIDTLKQCKTELWNHYIAFCTLKNAIVEFQCQSDFIKFICEHSKKT